MLWFYRLMQLITFIAFTLWYKIEYVGTENIPKKGGYILACNHLSLIDPILLSFKVPKMIHFLGKAELFSNSATSWFFKGIGGISIERGKGDINALEGFASLLSPKRNIGIFPEGTRSKTGEIGRAKSGLALVVKMTEADVLPCAIRRESGKKFKSKITIVYGKVIPYGSLELEEESIKALKSATKIIWSQVRVLAGFPAEEPKRIIQKKEVAIDVSEGENGPQ